MTMFPANNHSRQTNEGQVYLHVEHVKPLVEPRRHPKFYGMLKAPVITCSSPARTAVQELSEFDKCLQRVRAIERLNNPASASSFSSRQIAGFTATPTVISSYSVAITAPLPLATSNTAHCVIDWCPLPQLVLPTVNDCKNSMASAMEFEWTPEYTEVQPVSPYQFPEMQVALFDPSSVPVSAPLINYVDTTPDMEWVPAPSSQSSEAQSGFLFVPVSAPLVNFVDTALDMEWEESPVQVALAQIIVPVPDAAPAAVVPAADNMTGLVPSITPAGPRRIATCRGNSISTVAASASAVVVPPFATVIPLAPIVATVAPPLPVTYSRKPMSSVATSVDVAPTVTAAVIPGLTLAFPPSVPACPEKPISSAPVAVEAGKNQPAIDLDDIAAQIALGAEDSDQDAWDLALYQLGMLDSDSEEDLPVPSAPVVATGPAVVSSGPAVARSGVIFGNTDLSASLVLPNGPATPRKVKAMPTRRK